MVAKPDFNKTFSCTFHVQYITQYFLSKILSDDDVIRLVLNSAFCSQNTNINFNVISERKYFETKQKFGKYSPLTLSANLLFHTNKEVSTQTLNTRPVTTPCMLHYHHTAGASGNSRAFWEMSTVYVRLDIRPCKT